VREKW